MGGEDHGLPSSMLCEMSLHLVLKAAEAAAELLSPTGQVSECQAADVAAESWGRRSHAYILPGPGIG